MKKRLILASYKKLLENKKVNICITEDIFSLKEKDLSKYNIKVLKSHWHLPSKKIKDYNYLKKLYYLILKDLVKFLNNYHSKKISEKNWHIILGPWLNYAIPILWDRWENVKNLKKKFGKIKRINTTNNYANYLIPHDFNDFIEKAQCQSWNAEIFKKIIDTDKNWRPLYKKKYLLKKKNNATKNSVFLNLIDKILLVIQKLLPRKKYIMSVGNFEKRFYLELLFKNKKLTRLYNEFNESFKKVNKFEYKRNENLEIKSFFNKEFEKFLSKIILEILPVSYLENFQFYLMKVKKIKIKNKLIFTAFKHYKNDLFKIWLAYNDKKLISCIHGGNIEKEFFFNSWQKYSFKYIVWNKDELKKNQLNLPINFLIYRKKIKNLNYLNNNKIIFLLPHPEIKPLRLFDGLFSFEILDSIKKWIKFYNSLNDQCLINLSWRLGPFKDDWKIIEKLTSSLKKINISKEKSFIKDVNQARLAIHVDLQTTFLETMYMNIPTVVLINNRFWNVTKRGKFIIKKLERAKILFYNYNDMAKHINEHYLSLDKWWENSIVKDARLSYLKYSGANNINLEKKKWFNFFNNI